jgi:hypothetical protein
MPPASAAVQQGWASSIAAAAKLQQQCPSLLATELKHAAASSFK